MRIINVNKLKFLTIIFSIVLTLFGIVILGTLKNNSDLNNQTTINLNGETVETLKMDIDGFYPGKTVDYNITLNGDATNDYIVSLKFYNDNGGALKKYLNVKITANNETLTKPLEDFLTGNSIYVGNGVKKITISYMMPIETGDEAQGASVSFFVELNAKYVE